MVAAILLFLNSSPMPTPFFLRYTSAATELPLCEQCSADALQKLHVPPSGFHGVNAGGVHAGVTEDVRQPQQILFHVVKNAGEQMTQRMGKDLARVNPRPLTQGFHAPPDRAAVQRRFILREEHTAGGDAGLFHIAQQEPSQRGGAFLVFAQMLFKGLQLVHEIILRIVFCSLSMRVLYDTESVSPIKEAQLQNERVSQVGRVYRPSHFCVHGGGQIQHHN